MSSYTIKNLREISGIILGPFLANQRLNINAHWASETHPNTGRLFYGFSREGQLSPGALANVDFLCNKGAVFGETIKDTPYILTNTI
jgi:hypothetical protein